MSVGRIIILFALALGLVGTGVVAGLAAAGEHVVRPGETLTAVAARYGVSVHDLVRWNRLEDPNRLQVGQRLVVSPRTETYVVEPGDTLWSIAARFDTDVRRLAAWNGLDDPNRLYPGQVLVVAQGPATRHVVGRGDTLWSIARRYDVPADTLAEANGITNPRRLRIGQVLTIPVVATGGSEPDAGPLARPGEPARAGQIRLAWPVSGRITSRFGPRWGRHHYGLDVAAPTGTPVRAAAAGRVTFSGSRGNYGLLIVIDHGGGVETRYAHLSRLQVKEGDRVRQGQVIGRVGSTGNSTGPHLHFEVLIDGTHQDPERWLGPR